MQLMWRRLELFLLRLEIKSRYFFEATTKKTAQLLLLIYWVCFLVSLPVCIFWIIYLLPAGVAIGALGAAGVIVALRGEETPKGHRFLWAVVTLLLLVVEVKAINEDRSGQFLAHLHDLELQRAAQAQTLLHITLTNQAVMSQNQLQFEKTLSEVSGVADSARKQIRLSNEAISQVTGGDDFGYVLYDAYDGAFTFAHEGNHTLYGVIARFVDLKRFVENSSLQTTQENVIQLGDIQRTLRPIPFSDTQKQDFNIFFSARNGFWTQEIRLRFVNGKWLTATRMTQGGINPKTKKPFELVSPDFPRNKAGGIDWE